MILHPIPYKEGILWYASIPLEDNIKIIAQSPNLSLPDIPYIEINTATDRNYTQEDIMDAWEIGAKEGMPFTKAKKESLFNILNPKPVSVEIEMRKGCGIIIKPCDCSEMDMDCQCLIDKPITYTKDDKTFLKIKKVNYES